VPPDQFIPQVEAAGLAARMTELVVAAALTDLAGPAIGPLGISISVNIPLDVLLLSSALARLDVQRRVAGVRADRVVIELTESLPPDNVPALARAIERAGAAGYRVMLDDVGPAVPALDALMELPFAGIKLDKAVVHASRRPGAARSALVSLLARARGRGMAVVAEGVEQATHWRAMRALRVDQAQGYLIAAPMDAAAVPAWADAWRAGRGG
jgi:EAL domain-containing protein (putative c-di-GMP-specific phosphodiesterase class I)